MMKTTVLATTLLCLAALGAQSVNVHAQSPSDTAEPTRATQPTATPSPEAHKNGVLGQGSRGVSALSGHTYYDDDADGSRGTKDRPASGQTVIVDQLDENGAEIQDFVAASGDDGSWEVRDLAKGTYRVLWIPNTPPELTVGTSPRLEDVALDNRTTVKAASLSFELDGLQSITGIDFGLQVKPAVGLPNTGDGGSHGSLSLSIAFMVLLAAGVTVATVASRPLQGSVRILVVPLRLPPGTG